MTKIELPTQVEEILDPATPSQRIKALTRQSLSSNAAATVLPYYIGGKYNLNVLPTWEHIKQVQAQAAASRSAIKPVRLVILDGGAWPHKDIWGVLDKADSASYLTGSAQNRDPFWDSIPHGTHLAGIVAAEQNDLMVGLLPKGVVEVVVVKFIQGSWDGKSSNSSQGLICEECVPSIFENLAKTMASDEMIVVSMSWGGFSPMAGVKAAMEKYGSRMIFVAAAGNNGATQTHNPCNFEQVLCVAALDQYDRLAGFSNFGPAVDVLAYGEAVVSTWPNDQYARLRGTSQATPMVAAEAAELIWEARRQGKEGKFAPADIRAAIIDGAKPLVVSTDRLHPDPSDPSIDLSELVKCPKASFEGARLALQRKLDAQDAAVSRRKEPSRGSLPEALRTRP